jgi:hypothetical protein
LGWRYHPACENVLKPTSLRLFTQILSRRLAS